MIKRPKLSILIVRYGWVLKFPLVLVTTVLVKIKNRSLKSTNYLAHQKAIYGKNLFTDKSDKFGKVRRKIAQLALETGGEKVLDLATGGGWQALALKEVGFPEVVGIDVIEERIAFCRQVHQESGIKFQVMDGASLTFPDNYFDCSIVSAALHDMPPEVKREALKELARVSRNRVIIFEPRTFKNFLLARLYGVIGGLLDESLHFKEFVKADLNQELQESGLTILEDKPAWHGLMNLKVCQPKN